MAGIFVITIDILNSKVLSDFENLGEEFATELENTFKQVVFDINKYLIRITPIDTGELRGGWTAFLDSEREDYSRQIFDTSLAIKSRNAKYHMSPAAVSKGKVQGQYKFPDPLNVVLINNVPHGFYLEHGTSSLQGRNFTSLARYKGELRFETVFREWFEQIAEAGKVVPFKSKDEDITP